MAPSVTLTGYEVTAIDSTPPTVTISNVSDDLLNASETTTTVTWSANESGTYALKRGGSTCSNATAITGTNVSGSYVSGDITSTIDASSLADNASNIVRVCVTDGATNVGQDTTTITRDSVPPSGFPSTPDLDVSSDTGSSGTDNVTSDTTPTFTGSGTNGEIVEILVGGTVKGSGTVSGGSYSITTSTLSEGSHSVKARYTDLAGNKGSDSGTLTVTVDVTSDAPAISGSTPTSPANDNNPTINGTAEADSTVKLYTTSDCTGTVAGSGTATGAIFSIPVTVTNDTSTTYKSTATDAAGNVSACSSSFTYTEASASPSAPAISGSTPTSPANNNNPTINGTAEVGSTVKLYTTSDCTDTIAGSGTATLGVFSITVTVPNDTSTTFRATATDAAGNVSACSSSFTYTEDSTAPSVSAITRLDASPTGADSVQFTVTFSEAVTTVATTDFDLDASGVSATISSVTGSGATRTVTVSSITGDGTLSIDLDDDGSIQDRAGNPLDPTTFTEGPAYTIDNTAPAGLTITAPTTTISSTRPTFSGAAGTATGDSTSVTVKIYDSSNTLVRTGIGTRTGTSWSYDASADGGFTTLPDGSYTATVTQTDTASNSTTSSATFTIDATAPRVTSITRDGSSLTNTTGALSWTVVFSEPVTGVNAADFTLTGTGLSGTPAITGVTGSGDTYTVTASTGTGSGMLGIDLTDDDTIVDAAANPLRDDDADGSSSGPAYTIDRTDPTSSASISSTLQSSDSITVTHDADDSGGGTLDKVELWVETPDADATYELADTDLTPGVTRSFIYTAAAGDGTYSFYTLAYDTAGNVEAVPAGADDSIVIDATAPRVTSITRDGSSPTNAATVDFTVTFSEPVTGVTSADFSVAGSTTTSPSVTAVAGSGDTYIVTVATGTGSGTVDLDLVDDDTIADAAANKLGGTGTSGADDGSFTTGETYDIDKVAPGVSSITGPRLTSAPSINFTVAFSEVVTPVAIGDFTVTQGGGITGASVTNVVQGLGNTWVVSVGTGRGSGTIRLDVNDADGTIRDAAGNPLGSTTFTSGDVVTVDRTTPSVTSISRQNPATATTNLTAVTYRVTFSEAVTGVETSDFTTAATGTATGTISSVTPVSDSLYDVTVTSVGGVGTLRLDLIDDDSITDTVANQLGGAGTSGAADGSFTSGETYTLPINTLITAGPADGSTVYTDALQFSFASSVAGSTFECSLVPLGDADAFSTCVSPKTYSGLANGRYTFKVRATDGAGNVDPSPAEVDLTVANDSAAPSVAGDGTAGSATTDSDGEPGATPLDPVETSVSVPASASPSGPITISESSTITTSVPGWHLFGQEIEISAPAAAGPGDPLTVVFTIDGSVIPAGVVAADIRLLRNGVPLGDCVAAGTADPDPCQTAPAASGDDIVITAYTTRASTWNLGVAQASTPPPPPPSSSDSTPPVIQGGASSAVISPNGDGRLDELLVDVDFSEQADWTFEIIATGSVTADRSQRLLGLETVDEPLYRTTGSGTGAEVVWDGRSDDGIALPDGSYAWKVTAVDASGNASTPPSAAIRIDRTAPVVLGLRARPTPFDLDSDRKIRIRFRVSEDAVVRVKILRRGRVRKTFDAVRVTDPTATVRLTWRGRNDAGRLVRPGRYVVKIKAVDAAKNKVVNKALRLRVL